MSEKPVIMPKRSFSTYSSGDCLLTNIPLLRRLLTNEAALVQPGTLCAVSRTVCKTVNSVVNETGFWRDLTIRCMPGMLALPQDAMYFLQAGRFGPPETEKAQNMAWHLNYKRIIVCFLNMLVWYKIDNNPAKAFPFVVYRRLHCNAIDVVFRDIVRCVFVELPCVLGSTFQYDVNCGDGEQSVYRCTLRNDMMKHNFSSLPISFSVKLMTRTVAFEILTNLGTLHCNDSHLTNMRALELPLHSASYGTGSCMVVVSDAQHNAIATVTDTYTCYCAEQASVVLTNILQNHETGVYVLSGPQFTEKIRFHWHGDTIGLFASYSMGDLMDKNGKIRLIYA